jgi:hypothetical protein
MKHNITGENKLPSRWRRRTSLERLLSTHAPFDGRPSNERRQEQGKKECTTFHEFMVRTENSRQFVRLAFLRLGNRGPETQLFQLA